MGGTNGIPSNPKPLTNNDLSQLYYIHQSQQLHTIENESMVQPL